MRTKNEKEEIINEKDLKIENLQFKIDNMETAYENILHVSSIFFKFKYDLLLAD